VHNIRSTVEKIRAFRAGILRNSPDSPLSRHSLRDVKRVVIINSSSRSGSSLLFALLSKLPQVYSLSGEAAPFYRLNTLLQDFSLFESDKIPDALLDTAVDFEGLSKDFFSDLSCEQEVVRTKEIDKARYADQIMLRLALQWTDTDFDRSRLKACIDEAFDSYAAGRSAFDTEDFFLVLLGKVAAVYPQVNPFYYDISTEKVSLRFPFSDVASGPPNAWFNVEEPPFIILPPRPAVTPSDLAGKVLLLKSTVDCYRMNLIEKVFPDADIRIIHLVRNPAATANGIYDGWLHRGFFSHNMQPYFEGNGDIRELSIRGYSDRYPFGTTWWNFDLPEGWQEFARRDLVDVCAFQWYSANSEILKYLSEGRRKFCTVRFEDVIRDVPSRVHEFEKMLDFIGVPANEAEALQLEDLPVVQATLPPQLYRWKKRAAIIARVLEDKRIIDTAAGLGYLRENMDEWL